MRTWGGALWLLVMSGCLVSFDHAPGRIACGDGGACPSGLVCQATIDRCVDPRTLGPGALGTPCSGGGECQTGACVDGVCCNRLCDGQCESCSGATPGTCAPVTGQPVGGRPPCSGGEGVCAAACEGESSDCTFPTTECSAASCTDGIATAAATCSGGTCPVAQTLECATTVDTKLCGATSCAGVVDVVGNSAHTFAMMSDGSVYAWGYNYRGVLGFVTPQVIHRKPTRSPNLTGVRKLFSGSSLSHQCGVFDGNVVKCWGDNQSGQLGLGTKDSLDHPDPMPPLVSDGVPLTDVKDVAGTAYSTCAVKTDRSVICWGRGIDGRLADGDATEHERLYANTEIMPDTRIADYVAAGMNQVCIGQELLGQIYCFGKNGKGEAGVNPATVTTVTTAAVPASGPTNYDGFHPRPLSLGLDTSCGIAGGYAYCFGQNAYGVLGRGDSGPASDHNALPVCAQNTPTCTSDGRLSGVTSIGLGDDHGCAVADQAVKCWGTNSYGVLGTGTYTNVKYAGNGPVFSQPVIKLSSGQYHTCAILADRTLRCWGRNQYGDLGIPSEAEDSTTPIQPVW